MFGHLFLKVILLALELYKTGEYSSGATSGVTYTYLF